MALEVKAIFQFLLAAIIQCLNDPVLLEAVHTYCASL